MSISTVYQQRNRQRQRVMPGLCALVLYLRNQPALGRPGAGGRRPTYAELQAENARLKAASKKLQQEAAARNWRQAAAPPLRADGNAATESKPAVAQEETASLASLRP